MARSLFSALAMHELTRRRIAEAVVAGFEESPTHQAAEERAAVLKELGYMDAELAARVRAALVSNPQARLLVSVQDLAESALALWSL